MDGTSKCCTRGSDQTIPKEKKCKKAKWLSEEGLQIAEKRTEAIKKRWQQYTEELYKKDLNDPDNHDV